MPLYIDRKAYFFQIFLSFWATDTLDRMSRNSRCEPHVSFDISSSEFRFKLKQVFMLSLCICTHCLWLLVFTFCRVRFMVAAALTISERSKTPLQMLCVYISDKIWICGTLLRNWQSLQTSTRGCFEHFSFLRNCQSLETSNLPPNVQSNLLGWVFYPSKEIALCISAFWANLGQKVFRSASNMMFTWLREWSPYQNRWLFGKVPRGGGFISNPKIKFYCKIWTLK